MYADHCYSSCDIVSVVCCRRKRPFSPQTQTCRGAVAGKGALVGGPITRLFNSFGYHGYDDETFTDDVVDVEDTIPEKMPLPDVDVAGAGTPPPLSPNALSLYSDRRRSFHPLNPLCSRVHVTSARHMPRRVGKAADPLSLVPSDLGMPLIPRRKPASVIDIVQWGFAYESRLLVIRALQHLDLVDELHVVEGSFSFSGQPKKFSFSLDNLVSELAEILGSAEKAHNLTKKIHYHTVDLTLKLSLLEESTPNINFLRNIFTHFLELFLQLNPDEHLAG